MTPRVLLHGFTGSPASFSGACALAHGSFPCLAPVLLGHGPEPPPLGAEPRAAGSFEREVARVAAWLRERCSEPAHLVGYSMGARVALGLCLRHPELVSRATLIGVSAGLESELERTQRRAADDAWCDLLARRGLEAFADAWQDQPLFASQRRLAPELLEQQRAERLKHTPEGLAVALRQLGLAEMPNYWPELPRLTLPISLVAGSLDAKFVQIAERAQASLPHCRLQIVSGAGHNLLLEAPLHVAALLEESP